MSLKLNQGKDTVFKNYNRPFQFNAEVANAFDDMVNRSVPFYQEMQFMSAELTQKFATANSNIYDLGCATGTTLALIMQQIKLPNISYIGYDYSKDMLAKAKDKLKATQVELKCADINTLTKLDNASVVLILLTLQFVPTQHRAKIVKTIYDGINPNGALIMIEKLTCDNTHLDQIFIDHYYQLKSKNGYSQEEIDNKKQSLQHHLVPKTLKQNTQLLKQAGFQTIEVFFRWYNFCGIIAVKTQ